MDFRKRTIIALAVVALVLVSAVPMTNETDADDTPEQYGTTFGISLDEIDAFLELLTGMNFKELVESLVKEHTPYELEFTPSLGSKFALSREVYSNGGIIDITDRLSGYFDMVNFFDLEGKFPPAGTYTPNEGETQQEFLNRLLTTESTEQHLLQGDLNFGITLDLKNETVIDAATGEVIEFYISVFPSIAFNVESNLSIDFDVDDDGNITSVTVGYEKTVDRSDLYGDFQIRLSAEDLKVLGDGEWKCNPVITEHVVKSVVSKDMFGGVWDLIASQMEGKTNIPIMGLLLDIIGSTDKKLDLFKTIESLMGNPIPDITFVADATVKNFVDEHGDEYVTIEIVRAGEPTVLTLPMAGYKVSVLGILDEIPESIISKDAKEFIKTVISFLGWEYLDVKDISEDPAKQEEIAEIHQTIDDLNEWNEDYKFELPTVYLVTAIVIAILAVIATAFMWRGRI